MNLPGSVCVSFGLVMLLATGCSFFQTERFIGGNVDDPGDVVVDSSIEFVHQSDPRIEVLELPGGFGEGTSMIGGPDQATVVIYEPETCFAPPDVRVDDNGDTLEIEITDSPTQRPCAPDLLVYIELETAKDFESFTIKR